MKIRLDDNNNIIIIDNDGRMDLHSTIYHNIIFHKFVFAGKNVSNPYIKIKNIKLPIIYNHPLLLLDINCIEKQCLILYATLKGIPYRDRILDGFFAKHIN